MATRKGKKAARGKPATTSRKSASRKTASRKGSARDEGKTTRKKRKTSRGGGQDEERRGGARGGGRAFWSGTITFGLVSVPVDLFPALRSGGVSLRMLDEDGAPLRRRYFCPHDEREVSRDHLVRGYELEDGSHVVVTDEELEALAPRRSRDIDLRRFVARDEIDPAYFRRAYFLTPAGDSTKPYRLLAEAMERTGRAGIATFVMRGKEYLVAILSEGGILRAETMRFHDELRSPEDVGLDGDSEAPAKRVSAMEKAIRALEQEELDPDLLVDDHALRLRALAERKAKRGEDVVEAPALVEPEEPGEDDEDAGAPDLLETIRASLRAARGGDGRARGGGGLTRLSKDELYERAKEADVPGRSGMSKDELVRALRKRG